MSRGFEARLEQATLWYELPGPTQLAERLKREWRRREWLSRQIQEVEAERMQLFRTSGANPRSRAQTIGFEGTTTISRSASGIDFAGPMVSVEVELEITAAFGKQ